MILQTSRSYQSCLKPRNSEPDDPTGKKDYPRSTNSLPPPQIDRSDYRYNSKPRTRNSSKLLKPSWIAEPLVSSYRKTTQNGNKSKPRNYLHRFRYGTSTVR